MSDLAEDYNNAIQDLQVTMEALERIARIGDHVREPFQDGLAIEIARRVIAQLIVTATRRLEVSK